VPQEGVILATIITRENLERELTLEDMVLPQAIEQVVRYELLASHKHGRPFRHTLALAGMGGSGKSSLGFAIARALDAEQVLLVSAAPNRAEVDFLLANIEDGTFVLLDEALSLDTPIPTPEGWTLVGDLQPGSRIFGADGKPVTVLRLTPIKKGKTYKITFKDGSTITTDAGHKWLVFPKYNSGTSYAKKAKVLSTEDMFQDGRSFLLPRTPPVDLPELDLPVDPYVLGQWLGNGNVGQPHISIRTELLDLTLGELTGETVRVLGPVSGGSLIRVTLSDTDGRGGRGDKSDFRTRMESIGVWTEKILPIKYLRGSASQRLRLVQGLMDTDGWIDKNNSFCAFSTTSVSLADGMMELLHSLGYSATKTAKIDDREGVRGLHQQAYQVNFRGAPDRPPFLVRDTEFLRPSIHRTGPRIMKIEPVDAVPVRCIEVDSPDHLFLAGRSMVVTHNCHSYAKQTWLLDLLEGARSLGRQVDFTAYGATTNRGQLPQTIMSRFPIRLDINYNDEELSRIADQIASRFEIVLDEDGRGVLLRAAVGNPRTMRNILGFWDAGPREAVHMAQLTVDGLDGSALAMLEYLSDHGRPVGRATLARVLEAPGGIQDVESILIRRRYVAPTPSGLTITHAGNKRIKIRADKGI
jgi:Holliday junction resolvasome RuvABC ATP-dependent DNA helicase subunit